MTGYLKSHNPSGMNKRVYGALAMLKKYENTPEYQSFRAGGMGIKQALAATEKVLGGAA